MGAARSTAPPMGVRLQRWSGRFLDLAFIGGGLLIESLPSLELSPAGACRVYGATFLAVSIAIGIRRAHGFRPWRELVEGNPWPQFRATHPLASLALAPFVGILGVLAMVCLCMGIWTLPLATWTGSTFASAPSVLQVVVWCAGALSLIVAVAFAVTGGVGSVGSLAASDGAARMLVWMPAIALAGGWSCAQVAAAFSNAPWDSAWFGYVILVALFGPLRVAIEALGTSALSQLSLAATWIWTLVYYYPGIEL